MARNCSVCSSSRVREIDEALASGASLRPLAFKFGTTKSALSRHRLEHLLGDQVSEYQRPAILVQVPQDPKANVLEQVQALSRQTIAILQSAIGSDKLETAIRAIRESRAVLELEARISGEMRLEVHHSGGIGVASLDEILSATLDAEIIDVSAINTEQKALSAVQNDDDED